MTQDNISDRLGDIIPGLPQEKRDAQAANIHEQMSAVEIARLKLKAKRADIELETAKQQRQELAERHNMRVEDLGPEDTEESLTAKEQAEEQQAITEQIDQAAPVDPFDLSSVKVTTATGQALSPQQLMTLQTLQGTNRPEMAKLMSSLGINLSVRLSKTDTANLLACLMTCNETQLQALLANDKMPLALKAIIKRIIFDAGNGDTSTIERIWDRLFGKGPMSLDATPITGEGPMQNGLIPDQPISREAYIIIRDTLMR